MELSGVLLFQIGKTGEDVRLERRAGVCLDPFNQIFEWVSDHFGLLDHLDDFLLVLSSHIPPPAQGPSACHCIPFRPAAARSGPADLLVSTTARLFSPRILRRRRRRRADRKSTRLNSSHGSISYAGFYLK